MHETADDLERLQGLLDASFAAAGPHLLSIIEPERRLSAAEVAERLQGMRLLALATVTKDGRPLVGPVDGIFFRGSFYFGSSPSSVRLRHIRSRPSVSATHVPSESLAVTVHGTAVAIDLDAPEHAQFRQTVLDIYTPQYGTEWEDFLEEESAYVRIDARRMFTFHMNDSAGSGQR